MGAAVPVKLQVASMRVKWDETQQNVAPKLPAQGSTEHVAQTISTLVTVAFVKTSLMTRPAHWACPLGWLQKTTADCIWSGIARHVPFWPGVGDDDPGTLPRFPDLAWLWLVLVSDDASSNRRLVAHATKMAKAQRQQTL
eukprot:5171689-Prorocentrum_lima.AAC.1